MVGIQIAEYFVIRHRRLKLTDLYHARPDGIYYYFHGVNWRAFVSWGVGWASQIPGFIHAVNPSIVVPAGCNELYDLAYVLGFAISFLVHIGLNRIWPVKGLGEIDEEDYYGTFTEEEARKMGMAPYLESDGVEERVDYVADMKD